MQPWDRTAHVWSLALLYSGHMFRNIGDRSENLFVKDARLFIYNGGLYCTMRFVEVNNENDFIPTINMKEIKVEFPERKDNDYEDDMADMGLELSNVRSSWLSDCIESLDF